MLIIFCVYFNMTLLFMTHLFFDCIGQKALKKYLTQSAHVINVQFLSVLDSTNCVVYFIMYESE